jgi:uncharacterized protein YjbI with pentapeptide repeats
MVEEHQAEQKQHQNERSLVDRFLTTLGANPREWTVGDRRLVIFAIVMVLAIVITVVCGYVFRWEWTGLTKPEQRTFWDWLDLLIVPVVLALGGYLFNRSENRRTQHIANQQKELDREIANQRVKTDRDIAARRTLDDLLQAYLDQISQLVLDQSRPLGKSAKGDDVRTLARARTLTAINMLDAEHNSDLLNFLRDARFVGDLDDDEDPIIDLSSADLSRADLRDANLRDVNLSLTQLNDADLSGADLTGVDLSASKLRATRLTGANLQGAVLVKEVPLETATGTEMVLMGAGNPADSDLSTDLRRANLRGANLNAANLQGIDLQKAADLRSIDLWGTDLRGARLRETDLGEAIMSYRTLWSGADLRGADLSRVILKEVDLSRKDAENYIQKEIENAYGDEATKLPEYLQTPETWSKSIEEQRQILEARMREMYGDQ